MPHPTHAALVPASVANWMATHSSVERRIAVALAILVAIACLVDGAVAADDARRGIAFASRERWMPPLSPAPAR